MKTFSRNVASGRPIAVYGMINAQRVSVISNWVKRLDWAMK